MSFEKKELESFSYEYKQQDMIRLWLCADTKQIWQMLGMPTSWGTYPCPFCRVDCSEMQIPLSDRGFKPDRSYGGTLHLYKLNRRLSSLNRNTQKKFFNIIDEPKLTSALNGSKENDIPILDWILAPIMHIVRVTHLIPVSLLRCQN